LQSIVKSYFPVSPVWSSTGQSSRLLSITASCEMGCGLATVWAFGLLGPGTMVETMPGLSNARSFSLGCPRAVAVQPDTTGFLSPSDHLCRRPVLQPGIN
jgi:hypothetical protein